MKFHKVIRHRKAEVTIYGKRKSYPFYRLRHYVNGAPVSEKTLKIGPPYRIGAAELGNWSAMGFPEKDPFMIRNFSGGMDEFCLFGRALSEREIRSLYSQGRPQPEPIAKISK